MLRGLNRTAVSTLRQLEGHLPGISFCFFDSEDKLGTTIEPAGSTEPPADSVT